MSIDIEWTFQILQFMSEFYVDVTKSACRACHAWWGNTDSYSCKHLKCIKVHVKSLYFLVRHKVWYLSLKQMISVCLMVAPLTPLLLVDDAFCLLHLSLKALRCLYIYNVMHFTPSTSQTHCSETYTPPRFTCSFAFDLIGRSVPRRQSQVRLSNAKETKAAVKRNCWVLLGYLLLHLWFYGWRDALRKWVWKCFVGGQGIMRLGSQNSLAAQWGTGTQ